MTYKDYYKVLGVSKTATPDDIRKAYRKLAHLYHPDKTKGDSAAEEKFKDVNEANEVLSDPEKRKKYDQFGEDWKRYQEAGAQSGEFDWSKYDGGRGGQAHRMSREEFDAMFGEDGVGDLFDLLFGQQRSPRRGSRRAAMRGHDIEAETTLSPGEAYDGTTRLIDLGGQKIKVTIKPGIADGQELRIAGKGGAGIHGGPHGDLFLTVKIMPDPALHREGNDLHGDLPVELYTAVLGGKTKVKTPKGAINVKIPKGTQNGTVLRLKGLGMPIYGKKGEFGNLLVRVVIQIPQNLSEAEADLFRKLAALRK